MFGPDSVFAVTESENNGHMRAFPKTGAEANPNGRPMDIDNAWDQLGLIGQAWMLQDIYKAAKNGDRVAAGLIRGYARVFKRIKKENGLNG